MTIPTLVRRGVRRSLQPLLPTLRLLRRLPDALRSRASARALNAATSEVTSVCYLTPTFPDAPPARGDFAFGGMVKLTSMSRRFPHTYPRAKVLYGVSSVHHPDALAIVDAAKQRGLRFVLNQNGVYYRAWFGDGWEAYNRPLAALLRRADVVIYQSAFCQRAAERFLDAGPASSRVLYNPVDLSAFRPPPARATRPLTLLAAAVGAHRAHEMHTVIETWRLARQGGHDVHLVLAGYWAEVAADAASLQQLRALVHAGAMPQDRLHVLPQYSRREAPAIFAHGDILLHPVYNDASPNVVGEALASGLPVVFSASGGTPEIVGPAGIGVPAPEDWEVRHPPAPAALAEAIHRVAADLPTYAGLARRQAELHLDLDAYLQEHEAILQQAVAP